MRKLHYIIIVLMAMLISTKKIKAQSQLSQDPIYQLVFTDDFNTTALDTHKWAPHWPWGNNIVNTNYSTAVCGGIDIAYNSDTLNSLHNRVFNTTGTGYQEMISRRDSINRAQLVYYYPYDSTCKERGLAGGFGHGVKGIDGNGVAYCYYDSSYHYKYSTAMLYSKFNFRYGYMEMSFRTSNFVHSTANDYAPNFWMYNADDSAAYSEIDIFEMRGTDWKMGCNSHYRHKNPYGYTGPTNDTLFYHATTTGTTSSQFPYESRIQPSGTGQFIPGNWHTVGCEWTPCYADFYYYDVSSDTIQRFASSEWFPNKLTAMHLVIDAYCPAFQYCLFDSGAAKTQMPFNYDIDYVKVYQVNQDANCATTSGVFTSFATNSYVSKLYKDLTVGGSGSATLNSGSYHLAGQNYVELDAGFEASGSATVIVNTMCCQPNQTVKYNNVINAPQPFTPQLKKDIQTSKSTQ